MFARAQPPDLAPPAATGQHEEEVRMSEMLERVARAIYDEDPTIQFYDRPGSPPGNQLLYWDCALPGCKERARRQATAALQALMDPTEGMEADGDALIDFGCDGAKQVWQAMLTKAMEG
jgi:hypothetical protein